MRPAGLALVVFALLAPGVAQAYEAIFGMGAGVGYESNIFRSGTQVPDVVYLLKPSMRLSHRSRRFEASMDYRPVGEIFQRNPKGNGLDQVLALQLKYQLRPRTEVTASDSFGYVRNVGRLSNNVDVNEIEISTSRSLQNKAKLGLRHLLTPRTSASFTASHDTRSSTRENDQKRNTLSVSGTLSYQLTRDDVFGLGLTYARTTFEDSNPDRAQTPQELASELDARRSNSTNVFLVWSRTWNRQWQSSVRVGPALVTSTRTVSAPIVVQPFPILNPGIVVVIGSDPARVHTQSFTYFANGSLTRSWEDGSVSLTYTRTLSALSSTGVDTVVDGLFASGRWNINHDWALSGRVGWNQRQSVAANQAGGAVAAAATKVTQLNGKATLKRRLSRHLSASLSGRYLNQKTTGISTGASGSAPTFDNYQVNLSFRYEFSPVRP